MSALRLENLDKSFGGLHVTRSVSLNLDAGERVALIGPNGAGKTTLVNLISGALDASGGRVYLQGRDVSQQSQARRVQAGLVRTFQISTLAAEIPVGLQVEMALHQRDGLASMIWRPTTSFRVLREEARSILRDLNLLHTAMRTPPELPYGEQRMVELALALALRPVVLLLDEPMAGVPKSEAKTVLAALNALPRELAVLIIEHDMDFVFSFAKRIVVLAEGAVVAEGPPAQISNNPVVRAIYLGTKA